MRFLAVALCFSALGFFGCRSNREANDFKHSSTTDYYNAERFEREKNRRIRSMYTTSSRENLIGNSCVEEYTRKLGFVYIQPFLSPEFPVKVLDQWVNNTWVKTIVLLRKGPCWQRKLRKRIRFCRESSGDFIGQTKLPYPAPTG